MTREEIIHLGTLSRIALTANEVEKMQAEITDILEYVSVVQNLTDTDASITPTVGVRHNVLRDDVVTNKPGEYTERLLTSAPRRTGDYVTVPKIISQD